MKIRTDFVSNSSSSSFIVNKERHGSYFFQLFSMLKSMGNDVFSSIKVALNSKTNINDLLYGFSLVDKFKDSNNYNNIETWWAVSKSSDTDTNYFFVSTNNVDILCKLPPSVIENNVIEVAGYFHDYHDIGSCSNRLLDKLKSTGFKFEWNGI